MKKNIIIHLLFVVNIIGWLCSCSKLLEVDTPKNQLTSDKVFADSVAAVSALSNTYFLLANQVNNNLNKNINIYADEYVFTLTIAGQLEFNQSVLSVTNANSMQIWNNLYLIIYSCNDLLEQAIESTTLSENNKAVLVNEAKFLRAYAYFYLQNLYGRIPLLLQTDVNINRLAGQTDAAAVYAQIVQDLTEAKVGLAENYPSDGKVRANQWAATALLARTYLYTANWQAAEVEATAVINSGLYTPLDAPGSVFHAGSREAILQLWTQNGFISDATTLIPANNTTLPQYPVSEVLHEAFETDDLRQATWIGASEVTDAAGVTTTYPYPYKYKNRTVNTTTPEYLMALRLGEQYLIRAEARAQQGNIGGAVDDLNVIRSRAGLPPLASDLSQSECLDAVMQERRVELYGEWGHRFLDLKRTGQLDEVIGAYKSTWQSTASAFPIPQNEIIRNPNLVQNPGYD